MSAGNVLLMGDGKCIEGKYNKIRIMGSGDIDGNVVCKKLSCAGAANATGNIQFDELKIAGAFDGTGNLEGNDLRIMGACEVKGKIRVETCKIYGVMNLSETLEAETFILRGAIECAQSINCEKVMIQLLGTCHIDEMGASEVRIGEKIKIEEKGIKHKILNKSNMRIGNDKGSLKAQIIEGDSIYLDSAQVHTVRGGEIEIGPNCEIETIEYTKSIKIHESSKVGQQIHTTTRRNG